MTTETIPLTQEGEGIEGGARPTDRAGGAGAPEPLAASQPDGAHPSRSVGACRSCGSTETIDQLRERGFINCCPERAMNEVIERDYGVPAIAHSGDAPSRIDEIDFDDTFDDQCWNCSGEGFVSDCFEEYACLYPEDGCDLCTRRCDVCNPRPSDSDRNPKGGAACGSVHESAAIAATFIGAHPMTNIIEKLARGSIATALKGERA